MSAPIKKDITSAGLKPTRPLHILVVDDEPMGRRLVADYLTSDDHTVETARDGREGLEKFRADTFDVVLTDRAMPEMGGDQLAAAIKQEAPNMPVVLLTGYGDIIQATGEEAADVDVVVGKPVSLSDLRRAVAQVTGE